MLLMRTSSSPGVFAGPLFPPVCTRLCPPVAELPSYPPPTWGHFILSHFGLPVLQASHSSGSQLALGWSWGLT